MPALTGSIGPVCSRLLERHPASQPALQAYLETDPAHRGLPESYTLRYLNFAQSQVDDALKKYDALHRELGRAAMHNIEKADDKFSLVVADSLLARDRLKAEIRANEDSMQQKRSGGLSRQDLTFCD